MMVAWSQHKGELEVFGYGSLLWNPGFPHLDATPATLHGWHRAFCVYSHCYRGTPEKPGLVLGLDRGGTCHGLVFRAAAAEREDVLAYLRARELVTQVYLEQTLPVRCDHRTAQVLTYTADPTHTQYAGDLGFEKQAAIIAHAEGTAGRNRDYLSATAAELHRLRIPDPGLDKLLKAVEEIQDVRACE